MRSVMIGLWIMIWALLSMIATVPIGQWHLSAIVLFIGALWFVLASAVFALRGIRPIFWRSRKSRELFPKPDSIIS